jgi:hypothetical protein
MDVLIAAIVRLCRAGLKDVIDGAIDRAYVE